MNPEVTNALSDHDLHLFNEGTHVRLWEKLGAHPEAREGRHGTRFAVWAPNAAAVSVVGPFNDWTPGRHPLQPRGVSGLWEGYAADVGRGMQYKFHIVSRVGGYRVDKADPFAFHAEVPPATASLVWDLHYHWNDLAWMESRAGRHSLNAPMSIYELHVGSWRRVAGEGWRSLSYRELAPLLAEHVSAQGFTHVELMPVMEHPFFGSWGYQTTGYFAPSSRYGTPQDLMFLIDTLHQNGVGVFLDWVPSHFPTDEHGLGFFDGTHLYEHGDPRQGFHPDWKSLIFNYDRHEVRSFLLSSALYWLEVFHADGLRVDAVASMLYLDYSRPEGEWIPNPQGGRENLEAIGFLRRLNETVYGVLPEIQTIAEESTAWPMVSRPTSVGGLGFGLKWDMGWMHDMLEYMQNDPIYRKYHQGKLTFRMLYAFTENFVLPLSHDEVVYGKGSLLGKLPGDEWQRFANLRALYGAMWAQPGKKLLFMGAEFGQRAEWNHDGELEWHLLEQPKHQGIARWVRDLNTTYRAEPALHALDCDPAGFAWVDCDDAANSTISWMRRGGAAREVIVVACNFTPVPRHGVRLGVPYSGHWQELLNSDAPLYGGSGQGNLGGADAHPVSSHGHPQSLVVTLPPLGVVYLKGKPD
jgi:1,4-alpha-glucan branching enzyme